LAELLVVVMVSLGRADKAKEVFFLLVDDAVGCGVDLAPNRDFTSLAENKYEYLNSKMTKMRNITILSSLVSVMSPEQRAM
jgi:hypothetical protein